MEDPFLVDRISAVDMLSSLDRTRMASGKYLMTKKSDLHLYTTGIIETILTSQSSVLTVCKFPWPLFSLLFHQRCIWEGHRK